MATAAVGSGLVSGTFRYLLGLLTDHLSMEAVNYAGNELFGYLLGKYDEIQAQKNAKVINYDDVASSYWQGAYSSALGVIDWNIHYKDPLTKHNEYLEGKLKDIKPISTWCPLPQTGDEDLDKMIDYFWEATVLTPAGSIPSTNAPGGQYQAGNVKNGFKSWEEYWNAKFKPDANGRYVNQLVKDASGKVITLYGQGAVKQMGKEQMQNLLGSMKTFFEDTKEGLQGPNKYNFGALLRDDGDQFISFLNKMVTNQMNIMNEIMFPKEATIGGGATGDPRYAALNSYWGSLSQQAHTGQSLIENLGHVWKEAVPLIGYQNIWDMDYLPYYAEEFFKYTPNAVDDHQRNYLEWWYDHREQFDGMSSDDIWDAYLKDGHEDAVNDRPDWQHKPGEKPSNDPDNTPVPPNKPGNPTKPGFPIKPDDPSKPILINPNDPSKPGPVGPPTLHPGDLGKPPTTTPGDDGNNEEGGTPSNHKPYYNDSGTGSFWNNFFLNSTQKEYEQTGNRTNYDYMLDSASDFDPTIRDQLEQGGRFNEHENHETRMEDIV